MCDHPFSFLRDQRIETRQTESSGEVRVFRATCGLCIVHLERALTFVEVERPAAIDYDALVRTASATATADAKTRNTAAARARSKQYSPVPR